MPTVGEIKVPAPSVTLTLLTSHVGPVQSLSVSGLFAKYVPNIFWNERSFVVRSSSFLPSFAIQASHILFSTAIMVSVMLGSAADFVAAVFECVAALLSFFGSSFLPSAFAGGGFLGSMIRFSPWYAASHLSPLRT